MKIGIITFSWATNYGAVLQCYALQETLKQMGHEVEIINYKPTQFDDNIWNFIRFRKFINISNYLKDRKKEILISQFRRLYLHETKRFKYLKQLQLEAGYYDVVISGSDQVLNASFLRYGENCAPSTAYFLDFNVHAKKIMYAVSFGTTKYPDDCVPIVQPLIKNVNSISVRESSGIDIIEQFGRKDVCLVPDPTLLLRSENYTKFFSKREKKNVISLYMLRGREKFITNHRDFKYSINDCVKIEDWLENIYSSKYVITNSFHGVVFCILFHVPFLVVLEKEGKEGMNDRFYTLLSKLDLLGRITTETRCDYNILTKEIDWKHTDVLLDKFRNQGFNFLRESLI